MLTAPGIGLALTFLGSCGPAVGAIVSIYSFGGRDSVKKYFRQFLLNGIMKQKD